MATFKYFNVKVLPFSSSKEGMIGSDGYRSLWKELYRSTIAAFNSNKALTVSFSLRNDFYISLFSLKSNLYFSHGKFIKFDRPEGLYDSFSGTFVEKVPENVSAHRHEFIFVFDHMSHIAAIQQVSGKSPSVSVMQQALKELLSPVCSKMFSEHYVEVSVITSDSDYNKVFENAEYFKSAQVEISISNSDDFIGDEVAKTQDEMYEKGISHLIHKEASLKGLMTGLSDRCMAYLQIAKKNGNACLRYVHKKTGKTITYVMKDNPLTIRLSWPSKMSEESFVKVVEDSCASVQSRSTR